MGEGIVLRWFLHTFRLVTGGASFIRPPFPLFGFYSFFFLSFFCLFLLLILRLNKGKKE
jgi:hypothetical protein